MDEGKGSAKEIERAVYRGISRAIVEGAILIGFFTWLIWAISVGIQRSNERQKEAGKQRQYDSGWSPNKKMR